MSNLTPPELLKQIKPYITLATQLEQKGEKAIAYYCRVYAVQNGMSINKTAPECKKFLLQLMDLCENTKATSKSDEAIQSEIVGQAYVEKFALRIFEKADDEDRQAKFNKNLVKQFYSAGLLFDVINYFGELSEDLVAKKQYSKRKAMYLNKCFQTGETPIPGPLVDEEGFGADDYNEASGGVSADGVGSGGSGSGSAMPYYNENQATNLYPPSLPTSQVKPQSPTMPSSSSANRQSYPVPSASTYQDESVNRVGATALPTHLMQKAQKHCKYATSALQYDDINTAISNLEDCLRILKSGKD